MERVIKFEVAEGATPLEDEELQGLMPKHITTQGELNDWEYANIIQAEKWAYAKKHKDILSVSFLLLLHKKMFDQTWDWAGKFRKRQTNIGVVWHQIYSELKLLCDDTIFQSQNKVFSTPELVVRFHHRLVSIHPFPNGNGRHSRLMANLLSINLGEKRLSWGLTQNSQELTNTGKLRSEYLSALRKADSGEFKELIKFSI